MGKFVVRRVSTGIKFDLRAANGEIIATSEVYESAAACRRGITSVQKNAPRAKLEDQTLPDSTVLSNPKFELFQDRAGEYRFRLKARNGAVIAVSDGYSTKAACLGGIDSVRRNAPDAQSEAE